MIKTEVKDNNAPNNTGAVERYFKKLFIILKIYRIIIKKNYIKI